MGLVVVALLTSVRTPWKVPIYYINRVLLIFKRKPLYDICWVYFFNVQVRTKKDNDKSSYLNHSRKKEHHRNWTKAYKEESLFSKTKQTFLTGVPLWFLHDGCPHSICPIFLNKWFGVRRNCSVPSLKNHFLLQYFFHIWHCLSL